MNVASIEQRRLFGAHRRSLRRDHSQWTPHVERVRSVAPSIKASLTIVAWFAIFALCFQSSQAEFQDKSLSMLSNPNINSTSQSASSAPRTTPKATATSDNTVSEAAPADSGAVLPATDAPSTSAASNAAQYTSSGYAFGHCTFYVAKRRPIPQNWGNARDWLRNAKAAGFTTGAHARPGAIGQTPAGYYGHVVYVEKVEGTQVYVSEMNYVGWNVKSYRWANENEFSYIY